MFSCACYNAVLIMLVLSLCSFRPIIRNFYFQKLAAPRSNYCTVTVEWLPDILQTPTHGQSNGGQVTPITYDMCNCTEIDATNILRLFTLCFIAVWSHL